MNIFSFAEFESFYKNYNPFTPYGKKEKADRKLYCSEEYLETEYSFIDKVYKALVDKPKDLHVIEYHLKRIPNLNFLDNSYYTTTDIFQIKKFLYNYKHISDLLPEELYNELFYKFITTSLFRKLNLNGDKETFYLSEKYSEKLVQIRKEIKEFDIRINKLKKERFEYIKDKFGFDFRFQNFIVINEAKVLNVDGQYIYKESHDSSNVVIKPVLPKELFNLHNAKEELVKKEKVEENDIIINLSSDIKKELGIINSYIKSVHKLDIILAKAVLAKKFNMVKPELRKHGSNLEVKNGRSIPVMEYCKELETEYFPLNVSFNDRLIIISGSNMGGKTVVLKTIAFLQLLTQMGFYVPADKYKTSVFESLHYIGDLSYKHSAGLSSYGMEIFSFIKASETENMKSIFFIDEFAGTTNSFEAEALISAILSHFSGNNNIYSFLSTHFMNLPEFSSVSFYKMKGLDSAKFQKYYNTKSTYDFVERIKLINSFMRYEIEHDINREKSFDALKIAEILGLDKNIIQKARQFLK